MNLRWFSSSWKYGSRSSGIAHSTLYSYGNDAKSIPRKKHVAKAKDMD